MKRRILALPASLLLAVWATGSVAAAAPQGTVTVDTDGCNFTIKVDLVTQPDVVTWVVKEFNSSWWDGKTVLSGSGTPDAQGDLTAGPLTLPEGHYNVAVDDESPLDRSALVKGFELSCPAPSQSEQPSESVSPSQSEQPSESVAPSDSELPAQGSPSEQVQGITVTPPPTDSGPTGSPSDDSGARLALMGLAGLIVGSLFAARAARPATVRVQRNRNGR